MLFFLFSGAKIINYNCIGIGVLLLLRRNYRLYLNNMKKYIEHKELGTITICYNTKARKYRLKISDGKLIATLPLYGNEKDLLLFIDKNREQIKQALATTPRRPRFNEQTNLQTASFHVRINRLKSANCFFMAFHKDKLQIVCPENTYFDDDDVQNKLRSMIMAAMRYEAKRLLPARVKALADKYNFRCMRVKITSGHTRWGSCNNRGEINLSLFIMLLPWHLIDYIILHELCHTLEMNHGKQFHELLDMVTEGKSKALKEELNHYSMF